MLLALVLLVAPPLTILDNATEQTVDCGGREIVVNGNLSQLTFNGDCPLVTVNGNRNQVDISKATAIKVTGNQNQISWAGAAASAGPKVTNVGSNNVIKMSTTKSLSVSADGTDDTKVDMTKGGLSVGGMKIGHDGIDLGGAAKGVHAGAGITIAEGGQTKTVDCAGGSLTVSGGKNTLTVIGTCTTVTISGGKNQVTIENAAKIDVTGAKNVVTWSKSTSPKVTTIGAGNEVHVAK